MLTSKHTQQRQLVTNALGPTLPERSISRVSKDNVENFNIYFYTNFKTYT